MATGALKSLFASRRQEVKDKQLTKRLEKTKEVITTYRALTKKAAAACRMILMQLECTPQDLDLDITLPDALITDYPVIETLEAASTS